jgi:hypothetical protein
VIALLSNPAASANRARLPAITAWAALQPDIHHETVASIDGIAAALLRAEAIRPTMLVLNGGDGTARAVLSALYNGGHFAGHPPPVAILPGGKTNLIAGDLGASGDPLAVLQRLVAMARGERLHRIVPRALLALLHSDGDDAPTVGMFVGGGALAETILMCRRKLYPLGLPNGLAHALAAIAAVIAVLAGGWRGWHPARRALRITRPGHAPEQARLLVLLATTLERMLFGVRFGQPGGLKLVMVDSARRSMLGAARAMLVRRFGQQPVAGITAAATSEIRIEGPGSALIVDGETYRLPEHGAVIVRATRPFAFVSLA